MSLYLSTVGQRIKAERGRLRRFRASIAALMERLESLDVKTAASLRTALSVAQQLDDRLIEAQTHAEDAAREQRRAVS